MATVSFGCGPSWRPSFSRRFSWPGLLAAVDFLAAAFLAGALLHGALACGLLGHGLARRLLRGGFLGGFLLRCGLLRRLLGCCFRHVSRPSRWPAFPRGLNALRRYANEGTFVLGLRKSREDRAGVRRNVTIELSRPPRRCDAPVLRSARRIDAAFVNAADAGAHRAAEARRSSQTPVQPLFSNDLREFATRVGHARVRPTLRFRTRGARFISRARAPSVGARMRQSNFSSASLSHFFCGVTQTLRAERCDASELRKSQRAIRGR